MGKSPGRSDRRADVGGRLPCGCYHVCRQAQRPARNAGAKGWPHRKFVILGFYDETDPMSRCPPFLVAVTGAQGVGKSTFCHEIVRLLHLTGHRDARLYDGLGDRVRASGIPLGSTSTRDTIFAIWASHLEREAEIIDGLAILDRCVIDALAYTRVLGLNTNLELRVFEQVARLDLQRLSLVIHLEFSPFFAHRGADHETPELRQRVAEEIKAVLSHLGIPHVDLNAGDDDTLNVAIDVIAGMVA